VEYGGLVLNSSQLLLLLQKNGDYVEGLKRYSMLEGHGVVQKGGRLYDRKLGEVWG